MSDPTVEELLEELQDLLAGIPAEARPVVIKLAMQHVRHRHEQLMPLAPTGVEKEQIEMRCGTCGPSSPRSSARAPRSRRNSVCPSRAARDGPAQIARMLQNGSRSPLNVP